MQATVAVFGILRFPPDQMEEVRRHLKALVDATYRNDGCIAYDVGEDPFDPGLIRFSELWPSHEALDRHLKAPHIEPWRVVARRCGLMERKFVAYDVAATRDV
ncbi:putative quinol monooxygenase [Enhydrobacter aerosaccus]|uniref:putative quinol monooxygenase n=1 Tax=Enhydrobacter aerosaccus TaxID=225324 RepID=UPI000A2F8960|nr:putative quinol monooxygenase [Enhydrobacter aerosaccus]